MSCYAVTQTQFDEMLESFKRCDALRADEMPTDQDALRVMFLAHERLRKLGWRDIIYCPKDGTWFDSISAGSTGIHDCQYVGEWPKGTWWVADGGDLWPAHPILFRLKQQKD